MNKYINIFCNCFLVCAISISSSFAETLIIKGNYYVNKPTIIKNKRIDLTHGRIILQNNNSLVLENSIIETTISPSNPFYIYIGKGHLKLINNTVHVKSKNILADPYNQTLYYLVRIKEGSIDIQNNKFTMENPFTVGLFLTEENTPTADFKIINNEISGFHGGIYLLNNINSTISDNHFNRVSAANIFLYNARNTVLLRNEILYSGNLHVGNGFDVINSENITISNNSLYSTACYAMFLQGNNDVRIYKNDFYDGITYAVYLNDAIESKLHASPYNMPLPIHSKLEILPNKHIEISHNVITKNRFAFAGGNVDGLIISDNLSINKFKDDYSRQFWTDTDNLFHNISHFTWSNNLYKEAYDQDVPGDNTKTTQFYTIPERGGLLIN